MKVNSEDFEQIIVDLRHQLENRPNKLVYMKYKTFLKRFGMQRRSSEKLALISELLEKHKIVAYARLEEGWDLTELPPNETITFRLEDSEVMNKVERKIAVDYAGTIRIEPGEHPKDLYRHQEDAIKALNRQVIEANKYPFAGLLVIPTGGGKTLTAVRWLLTHYIDNNKKVLWVAHRHELLEQANVVRPRNWTVS
jgi:CRISPR/Cas system-associated endonuclease/helicase Cas3